MQPIGLMTELEAVNEMLGSIGEAPVSTLENPDADVAMAATLLRSKSRAVQAEGWHFNTDKGRRLSATTAGEVTLPANTLRVDTIYPDGELDVIQRGYRLYDRRKHTYAIGRPVLVDLVLGLAFDELPVIAQRVILQEAGLQFVDNTLASQVSHAFSAAEAQKAWAALREAEIDTADANMLQDNPDILILTGRRVIGA
jgi:hypothetical protein